MNTKLHVQIAVILFFILHLTGCQTKNEEIKLNFLVTNDMAVTEDTHNKLSEVLENVRFIPLTTNDSCLIGEIDKVKKIDDKYYVQFNRSKLYVFNSNGSFDRPIGVLGNGPGEYELINDFCIKDDSVYLLGYGTIHQYLSDGTFLKNIKIPFSAYGIARLNEEFLVYSAHQEAPGIINRVDLDGKVIESFGERTLSAKILKPQTLLPYNTSKIIFQYYITNNLILYNMRSKKFEPAIFRDDYKIYSSEESDLSKGDARNFSGYVLSIYPSGMQTIFKRKSVKDKTDYFDVISLDNTLKTYKINQLDDDITYSSSRFLSNLLYTSSTGYFISFIEAPILKECIDKAGESAQSEYATMAKEILSKINPDESNPILISFSFK